jgi:YYY domain-containing protein
MAILIFLLAVMGAGFGGYALLVWMGLDDIEAWAGGRVAGLVMVALPAWWAGVIGVVHWRSLGAAALIVASIVGLGVAWRRRRWRSLLIAEAVFLGIGAAVIFIRLDHPQIALTEKPMDLGIFASLLRAEGFPPPDMWLAGESLPYYYWGALLWTVPLWASGLPLEFGYNLVVGLIWGMVGCLLWMLGRRAGGGHLSGLLVAFFGLLAGTPDGMRQLIAGKNLSALDYWHSSRQVPDTITEWPLFTAHLGDLHPHLLSMPIACLAFLVAWHAGKKGPTALQTVWLAVLFGVTWAANPWAMPPTLAGIALLLVAGANRWYWPKGEGLRRWMSIAAIAVGGWLVTAPFHLGFTPFFRGIKKVFAWTDPGHLLLYGGILLVPAGIAAFALLWSMFEIEPVAKRALLLLAIAATLVLASATARPTLIILLVFLGIFVVAVLRAVSGEDRPVLALTVLAIFLFVVPEIVYVADDYGEALHRMNTVFKAYIQGWVLLAIALPVLLRVGFRRPAVRWGVLGLMVLLALPHPAGMVLQQFKAATWSLDGMAWMHPGDRTLVRALRHEPPGTLMIETVGGAYTEYARLSSASGVPTYLGWANHEGVWRGNEIHSETDLRRQLVSRLYSCGDPQEVRRHAKAAGVHLVAIGALERKDFSPVQLPGKGRYSSVSPHPKGYDGCDGGATRAERRDSGLQRGDQHRADVRALDRSAGGTRRRSRDPLRRRWFG